MAEISRMTGFDRATARRLCLTLQANGYLEKNDSAFRLLPKIMAVAGGYLSANNFGHSVQPVLNQFSAELGTEITYAMRDGDRAIFVAQSATASARVSFGFSIGSTLPLLPTAVGRMLLARCPAHELDTVLSGLTPEQFTEATDVDLGSIRDAIRKAATQGYSFVRNEFEMGAAGIAVPIGKIGSSPAVLSTTASVNKFDDAIEFNRVLDVLRRAVMSLQS
jgi:IclR family pca regulon transcriptional regulator